MADQNDPARRLSHLDPLNWALPDAPAFDTSRLDELSRSIARTTQQRVQREKTIAQAAAMSLEAASRCVNALVERIATFEEGLAADEEVSIYVIGGPAGQAFFPTTLQPIDPDKIVFGGLDSNERPFQVVQHVSQLNFAMQAMKVAPNEAPRRIGFHFPEDDQSASQ
jgi:hypothetical protein